MIFIYFTLMTLGLYFVYKISYNAWRNSDLEVIKDNIQNKEKRYETVLSFNKYHNKDIKSKNDYVNKFKQGDE